MSLRRIKHTFLRLSAEEKVTGLGALFVLIGIFMPWYSVVMNFDKKSITESGLSGDIGVLGFVILLMVILTLLVLVGEHLHIKLPRLGYTKEQMLFFLMGQSTFMVLLAIAVYTKRSLEFTDAGLRFGIYFALIGAFLGTFAIFSQIQKLKKKEVQEFFEHEEPTEEVVEEQIEEQVKKHVGSSVETRHGTSTEDEEPEEDQMLFEEEAQKKEQEEEEIPEDEMIEEIEEIIKEEEENVPTEEELNGNDEPDDAETQDIASPEEEDEVSEEESEDQGDYFMREAGMEETEKTESKSDDVETQNLASPTEEGEKEPEKDKKDKSSGLSTGFYEDQ